MAALAAGADAIYVGLKHFSARMQADNFSISELARLRQLAAAQGTRLYVAMNTLLKPDDAPAAARLIDRLKKHVGPDALIIQDLGFVDLARQVGYKGEIHLSTLANVSHPAGLQTAAKLGANKVVLPRELNLDEAKEMAKACPKGMSLEIFVHGALCYSVSGRCYWSSYFGGKSGLRGRCVQPCRRLYKQAGPIGKPSRLFSCLDLSLDVLTKPLLDVPQITTWKIEGRKKGPHYVFYTVKAYQTLRDESSAESKKYAQSLLEQALSRPTTHSIFLPQRPFTPVDPKKETASGLFLGNVKMDGKRAYFQTRHELLPGDLIRAGYEDESWHQTIKIRRKVPRRGRMDIGKPRGKGSMSGAQVFLVDRRERELMKLINALEQKAEALPEIKPAKHSNFSPRYPRPYSGKARSRHMNVFRNPPKSGLPGGAGLWLDKNTLARVKGKADKITWWLPPVIWPNEENEYTDALSQALKKGSRSFVLNAPWQISLFKEPRKHRLIAGPFCNIANAHALERLRHLGFHAAIASPELTREDALALPAKSPLPLGFVTRGLWPLGISRIMAEEIKLREPIYSPRNEVCWADKFGGSYWIFPGWELNLSDETKLLEKVGYTFFVTMREFRPKEVDKADRTSTFNWKLKLL